MEPAVEFAFRRNIAVLAAMMFTVASAVAILFFLQINRARDDAARVAHEVADERVKDVIAFLENEVAMDIRKMQDRVEVDVIDSLEALIVPLSDRFAVPVGVVVRFAGPVDATPQDWLICDGRKLLRSDYPELNRAIGITHGGDSDFFLLPDLRDESEGSDSPQLVSLIKAR